MTVARPDQLPRWADDPAAGYPGPIEPSEAKKDNGWRNGEAPAAGHVNWLFHDHGEWFQYLDEQLRNIRPGDHALSNQVDVSPSGSDQIEAFAINPDTGTIIAVGANGAIKKSTDFGRSWASKTADLTYTGTFRTAAYGVGSVDGTVFLIAGSSGMVQRSLDDGDTWVAAPIGGSIDHTALAHLSGVFLLCSGGETFVRVSTTGGLSWVNQGLGPSPGPAPSATMHGGTFVVGDSDSAQVFSCDDLATWTTRSLTAVAPGMTGVTDVTYSPVLGFVAVGKSATDSWVLTSPDAITWTVYLHLPGASTAAFAATGAATAGYVFGNGGGARVLDGGVSDRELLQPTNMATNSSRVALLESTTPRASAFFFADQTSPGKIYRSQIWSPTS